MFTAAPPVGAAVDFPTLNGGPPIVIGHRGASGYLPEHTLAAYRLAMEAGADFIEPDLVSTRDGVLIARHEVNISETTDVSERPEFAARKTTKTIDGAVEEGWFADDFTLAEIRTLYAKQRLPFRSQAYDRQFRVPTFDEAVALAQREGQRLHRTIGVYPETKHPSYHRSVHLALEDKLLAVLAKHGWNSRQAPVFIQSFEVGNLKDLRRKTRVRLVQLIDCANIAPDGRIAPRQPYDWTLAGDPRSSDYLVSKPGLAEIARYADGIGPWKRYLVSLKGGDAKGAGTDAEKSVLPPSSLVADAHSVGLSVHAWTFRNEGRFLATDYRGDPIEEYRQFYRLGVDGVFSDFPDTAVTARSLAGLAGNACR